MSVTLQENPARRIASSTQVCNGHVKGKSPQISLLLSTYQKPWHLQRVLTSIAMQEQVADRMELIVTDDGSSDETADLVVRFAQSVRFPVRFTTHEHSGFQLARCRNEGVMASKAPYLLFLDGDCLLPPDHVWQHLRHRRPGEVMGGYCVRLEREVSERIDEEAVRAQAYLKLGSRSELRRLAIRHWKSRFYRLMRHPMKPKLAGGNIGIWKSDYERVNGYDENFQGWGAEDDDLRRRLGRVGVKIGSILRWTRTFHLWHPPEPSAPQRASHGANYKYFLRRGALNRCRNGLVKRSFDQLKFQLANHSDLSLAAQTWLESNRIPVRPASAKRDEQPAEVEVGFYPGVCQFDSKSECRILVVMERHDSLPAKLLKNADIILSDQPLKGAEHATCRPLAETSAVLAKL